jgi:sugar lactone lactonase YvrE
MEWKAELALDARADLGEGPVWDETGQRLIWVDIMAGRVHAFAPARGATQAWEVGEPAGAAALRERGGLILAVQSGFLALDDATGTAQPIATYPDASPDIRMNDGKCDPAGRFWAGTMAFDLRPGAGALYRLDGAPQADRIIPGVTVSNGLDWSPDGAAMYYIDSLTRRIDVFDYHVETGHIENRRTFVEIEEGAGFPDGMTVDAQGNVWVALWGGNAVRCYAPAGRLAGVVRVPASQASSCAFGGADLGDLYITSARTGLSAEALAGEETAGGVFVARPGAKGRPPWKYRG